MNKSSTHHLIRSRLKTRHILLLSALAEEPVIDRAAERLKMTQPAVSRLLKEMENILNISLFERLARGLKPTLYGQIMIRHAHAILANMDQAQEEISNFRQGLAGTVRIGSILSPGAHLIPKIISQLQAIAPKIKISVTIDVSGKLSAQLQAGQLDILLARLPTDQDSSGFQFDQIGTESIVVIAGRKHPLMDKEDLNISDLLRFRWILPPAGGILRQKIELTCKFFGVEPPENAVETVALPVINGLLEHTDMISPISAEVAHQYASYGRIGILPVDIQCNLDPYGIIMLKDKARSPCVTTVFNLILDEIKRKTNKESNENKENIKLIKSMKKINN